jgi:4,5-dihydroxyphthalate decarboxylase
MKLDFAIASYPHTAALLSGEVPITGVTPNFIQVIPQIGAFRRMVRRVEFDVCEIAPTTYIIARAYGAPFVALPIFVMRRFHHGGLLVRPDAGIKHPKDLEGRKVGVRAYSVTTGVWTRGILIDEFGLDSAKVTWVVDDEEHVRELKLPPNVIHAPEGRSLADMMAAGELAAGYRCQRRDWSIRFAHRRWLEAGRGELSRSVPQCGGARSRLVQENRHLPDARHHRGEG